jgi:AcrR family transcriptional regulator
MTRVTTAHLEARKGSILEAALRVFARRGIQYATMAEIAEDAGISAGAIYRYFPGKDALIEACFEENVEAMTAEWHQTVEATPDPLQALYNIAHSSFAHMEEANGDDTTRVMIERILDGSRIGDAEWRKESLAERELVARGLTEPLARAQELGLLPKEIDAYQLAQALLSFYFGARLAHLLGPETNTRGQLEAVFALVARVSAFERERTGAAVPE